MSHVLSHPAYAPLADRLDLVGQRYRVQRIVRGLILLVATLLVATPLAGLLAAWGGWGGRLVLLAYGCGVLAAVFAWLVRPLLLRVGDVQVARMIERRLPGLHNGLTNAALLARADDLQSSPLLEPIFGEILQTTANARLEDAVTFADLRPLALRAGAVSLTALAAGLLLFSTVAHGWREMLSPDAFVPKQGSAEIVDVKPGDVTVITGRPLEIVVAAMGANGTARVFFDPTDKPDGEAMQTFGVDAASGASGAESFTARVPHVDRAMRYRVDVNGTESRWFDVQVVREIKLTRVHAKLTPPAYTMPRATAQTLAWDGDKLPDQPIAAPLGTAVEFYADVDLPTAGALVQVGKEAPRKAELAQQNTRLVGSFTLADDVDLRLLLTDASGQVVATLPDKPLTFRATPDAPPGVEWRSPRTDAVMAPNAEIKLSALARDDYGVSSWRVLMSPSPDAPLAVVREEKVVGDRNDVAIEHTLQLPPELRRHGAAVRVQIQATDNRQLGSVRSELGPQTGQSSIIEVRLRDPEQAKLEQKQEFDRLRDLLRKMLDQQTSLHTTTVDLKPADGKAYAPVGKGQAALRDFMQKTADTFEFGPSTRTVQKTLLVLVSGPAKEAPELVTQLATEPVEKARAQLANELQSRQRRIIAILESLLAMAQPPAEPTTQPGKNGGDLPTPAEAMERLKEDLKRFQDEQRKLLDQAAPLAKKPVDDWTEADKKLAAELAMAQEKLDAFLQEKISDFSKLAEQDMANASLLRELMEVYSEVTMAKDALKKNAAEVAVSLEESGLELAQEITTNLEKWLMDQPDRQKWNMEDPTGKNDLPMAELPGELEDMAGELMEQQEDLFEEMEDTNANWADSMDKGAGWDAADGPIANMSAKGVTGNQLPNNNEMGGRAGEGRGGKSQGEFVEETASGKGGRNTPTRLDPTPFQQGQVKDESKDPVGGATGGGKVSGQGGEGLEGPVPPKMKEQMQRLAQKQAQLRNAAERIQLQHNVGRYDQFKLLEAIAMMRRVESDLNANRYGNALRRRDVLVDDLAESRLLLTGQIAVQQDTTPQAQSKLKDEIGDAMKGELPAGWSEPLREYYRKLSESK